MCISMIKKTAHWHNLLTQFFGYQERACQRMTFPQLQLQSLCYWHFLAFPENIGVEKNIFVLFSLQFLLW